MHLINIQSVTSTKCTDEDLNLLVLRRTWVKSRGYISLCIMLPKKCTKYSGLLFHWLISDFSKVVLKSSVIPFKLARGAQLRIDFVLVTPQSSGSLHLAVTGLQLSKPLKTTLKKVSGSITSDTGSSSRALNMYHLLPFCLLYRAELKM